MPSFPISRAPLYGSYQRGGLKPSVARTAMEVGPPKVRRRSSRATRSLSARYAITNAEAATFETWVRVHIGLGAELFDWPDPITDAVRTVRFAEDGGFAMAQLAPGWIELSINIEEWS